MGKSRLLWGLLLVGVLCITGCGEKEVSEDINTPGVTESVKDTGNKEEDTKTVLVSEDYRWGNTTNTFGQQLMKTDTGHYYYAWEKNGMTYWDEATGKTMFLCNKPECRHDGNKFCAATNNAYSHLSHCFYSGKLYFSAWERTDTQMQLKLFSMSLDGSELNEEMLIYTTSSVGARMSFYREPMVFHRNYVMIPIHFIVIEGSEADYEMTNEEYMGAALVNLETKEVTFLDEEPIGLDNFEVTDITAYGDYFFFCKQTRKKTELHYYNFKEKTDEVCRLLVGFKGSYAVLDEKRVAYTKKNGTSLYIYDLETKETTELADKEMFRMNVVNEYVDTEGDTFEHESKKQLYPNGVNTDGTYIYLGLSPYTEKGENGTDELFVMLYVFDKNLELVTKVNCAEIAEGITELELSEYQMDCSNSFFRYTGEEMFYEVYPIDSPESQGTYLYRLKRAELLDGKPKLEFLYER